jgi:hypothetical protein
LIEKIRVGEVDRSKEQGVAVNVLQQLSTAQSTTTHQPNGADSILRLQPFQIAVHGYLARPFKGIALFEFFPMVGASGTALSNAIFRDRLLLAKLKISMALLVFCEHSKRGERNEG